MEGLTMASPGERLEGESSRAYAAFCLYRDLGPRRSIDAASRLYHHGQQDGDDTQGRRRPRASGRIRLWAERWHWSARARAWDAELALAQRTEEIAALKEMVERHAKEALMLQNKAIERLRQLRPEELKPRETLDFLVSAAKLERLARGETEPIKEPPEQETTTHESDVFTRIEQYADAFRPFLEPVLEAGGLPSHCRGEPLDQAPPDLETTAGTPP
jgi:hypothetical protein